MRIPGASTIHLWEAHGTHGRLMGVPWEGQRYTKAHSRSMGDPWGGHDKSMGKHCASRGRPMGTLQTCGGPMKFRLAISFIPNPWEAYWGPVGVPWGTKGSSKPIEDPQKSRG